MRAEVRDRLIERLDEVARWAGASDFDSGMADATRFFAALLEGIQRMKTKDDLRKLLDELPDLSMAEEQLLLASARFAPQLLSAAAKYLAKQLGADAPPL